MKRKIFLALTVVGCLLFSASDIFAQCGLPGTPPCTNAPEAIGAKPKGSIPTGKGKSVKKNNPAKATLKKTTVVPKGSALFARLLGEWSHVGERNPYNMIYQENKIGFLSIKNKPCVRFSFTLSKNVMNFLNPKRTGECEGFNNMSETRFLLEFDKAGRVGMTEIKEDGTLDKQAEWFVRVKK